MNVYLRDKLLQKLDSLSDERGYQVEIDITARARLAAFDEPRLPHRPAAGMVEVRRARLGGRGGQSADALRGRRRGDAPRG